MTLNDYPPDDVFFDWVKRLIESSPQIGEGNVETFPDVPYNTINVKTNCDPESLHNTNVNVNVKIQYDISCEYCGPEPSMSPTQTPTPTLTPTKTVTPSVTRTPDASQEPTPTMTKTPTLTPTPTYTPTLTKTPTQTPTPTKPCVRPPGLPTYNFLYCEGPDPNCISFVTNLTSACDALSGTAFRGFIVQVASLTIGQTVYMLLGTNCNLILDGYYVVNGVVVQTINGVIVSFPICS
jgi:hypothetical protein